MSSSPEINFFGEEVEIPVDQLESIKTWILAISGHFSVEIDAINYIFCNDEYLKDLNIKYLDHDYYTDIITFETASNNGLCGDIFISVDTVIQNASRFVTTPENEFHRVIAHGLLHLIGFKDKTDEEFVEMKRQEDYCLSLRSFLNPS